MLNYATYAIQKSLAYLESVFGTSPGETVKEIATNPACPTYDIVQAQWAGVKWGTYQFQRPATAGTEGFQIIRTPGGLLGGGTPGQPPVFVIDEGYTGVIYQHSLDVTAVGLGHDFSIEQIPADAILSGGIFQRHRIWQQNVAAVGRFLPHGVTQVARSQFYSNLVVIQPRSAIFIQTTGAGLAYEYNAIIIQIPLGLPLPI